jgi:hypothetical protein
VFHFVLNRRTVPDMTMYETAKLQDVHMSAQGQCTVLSCGLPGLTKWSSATARAGWPAEWVVCPTHEAKLRADHAWQFVHGQPPEWHGWILMGNDIGKLARDVHDHAHAPAASAASNNPWGGASR